MARLNAMHAAGPPRKPSKTTLVTREQTADEIFAARLAVPALAQTRRSTAKYKAETYPEFADF